MIISESQNLIVNLIFDILQSRTLVFDVEQGLHHSRRYEFVGTTRLLPILWDFLLFFVYPECAQTISQFLQKVLRSIPKDVVSNYFYKMVLFTVVCSLCLGP